MPRSGAAAIRFFFDIPFDAIKHTLQPAESDCNSAVLALILTICQPQYIAMEKVALTPFVKHILQSLQSACMGPCHCLWYPVVRSVPSV